MKISKLSLIAVPALLAGCSAIPSSAPESGVIYPDKPEVVTTARPDNMPKPRSDRQLQNVMLQTHNDARRVVGLGSMSWDTNLEKTAKAYAEKLARSGKFEHDKQKGVSPREGENLWMGTRGAFGYAEMSGSWIDEKRYYKRGIFPGSSNTGNWSDVGHYTQIIWRGTTRVGWAVASSSRDDYLVCRYAPAGNVMGRDPLTS